MPTEIRFGTDGWRAVIAEEYTFENVRACAQGFAADLVANGAPDAGVVVAWDTRFGSERFAAAVAEVLAGNGIRAALCSRPTPTPAASFSVMERGAAGGIVITASHNPGEWNGFKVKSPEGGSAGPESVTRIEARVQEAQADPSRVQRVPLREAEAAGLVERFDPIPPYLEQLGKLVDTGPIRDAGLSVVVDAMFGAGGGLLPRLLSGGATTVVEINPEPNPAFPGMGQPEPVEANLARLSALVRDQGADAGVALDGDADRLGLVDENGRYLSTLEGFSLLAHHLLERRGERGAIVSTITMSSMVDRLADAYGVEAPRTAVGFKYVGPKMLELDAMLGGEESGGYALRGHVPERDGILSGLLFLEAMVTSGMRPSELLNTLHAVTGPHRFQRVDLTFDPGSRGELAERIATAAPGSLGGLAVDEVDRRDGVKFHLAGGAWAVIRLSGTEPLLRTYAEAADDASVDRLLSGLRELLGL